MCLFVYLYFVDLSISMYLYLSIWICLSVFVDLADFVGLSISALIFVFIRFCYLCLFISEYIFDYLLLNMFREMVYKFYLC